MACKFQTMAKPQPCNFIKKEILAQVLSCEFYKVCKNPFFTEHLQTTASIMNSFVTPHDLMSGQIGSYAYMKTNKNCEKAL